MSSYIIDYNIILIYNKSFFLLLTPVLLHGHRVDTCLPPSLTCTIE
jgi:hypothetical protein